MAASTLPIGAPARTAEASHSTNPRIDTPEASRLDPFDFLNAENALTAELVGTALAMTGPERMEGSTDFLPLVNGLCKHPVFRQCAEHTIDGITDAEAAKEHEMAVWNCAQFAQYCLRVGYFAAVMRAKQEQVTAPVSEEAARADKRLRTALQERWPRFVFLSHEISDALQASDDELARGHVLDGMQLDVIMALPLFRENADLLAQGLLEADAEEKNPDDLREAKHVQIAMHDIAVFRAGCLAALKGGAR